MVHVSTGNVYQFCVLIRGFIRKYANQVLEFPLHSPDNTSVIPWATMLSYLVLLCVFSTLVIASPTGDLTDINDDLSDITNEEPLPTPAGIRNFLGVGYNIIDGNPEGGDIYLGGVDPGLLVTRPILKLTYEENQLTSDLQYIVPDQVFILSAPLISSIFLFKRDKIVT